MKRIAIPTLLLALAAAGNVQAAGLELNTTVTKLTGSLPGLGSLLNAKGPTLPALGKLPGLNVNVPSFVFLLGGVNISGLTDGIDPSITGKGFLSGVTNNLPLGLSLDR